MRPERRPLLRLLAVSGTLSLLTGLSSLGMAQGTAPTNGPAATPRSAQEAADATNATNATGATGATAAADTPLYRLAGADVTVADGAVVLRHDGKELTYVQGLGWLGNVSAPPPQVVGGEVLVGAPLLDLLGLELPRLDGVRFGGDVGVRVVLDLPGLAESDLEGLRLQGRVGAADDLRLHLPPMLLPVGSPDPYRGFEVTVDPEVGGTSVTVAGGAFHYDVFPLADPTRLVLHLVPEATPRVPELEKVIAPGVLYRRIHAPGPTGESLVHIVSIAPGAGDLRVVGESRVARPLSELASGGIAAINAGYFDTSTFAAIGYLKVDYGLLSLPSRNRASVAFGPAGTTIARVQADVGLRVDGRLLEVGDSRAEDVGVATAPGTDVGRPTVGVITVEDGVVEGNTIGPRRVPRDGFAVVYPPDARELARVEPGDRATLQLGLQPQSFAAARYGVEAGPLLVANGRAAYDPAQEGFPAGQRILDAVTQQAAIGLMPDGTVLLVVAEAMRAADMVPLFLSLGARSAMRLDSGSSATLFADGTVLNRRFERKVVSAIVVVPPDRAGTAP